MRRGLRGKKNDSFGSTGDEIEGQAKATTDGQNQGRELMKEKGIRQELCAGLEVIRQIHRPHGPQVE